jgi:hypothetical protein
MTWRLASPACRCGWRWFPQRSQVADIGILLLMVKLLPALKPTPMLLLPVSLSSELAPSAVLLAPALLFGVGEQRNRKLT